MNHQKTRILIADNDEAARDQVGRLLTRDLSQLDMEVEIEAAESIALAKKKLDRDIDLVILDWHFEDDPEHHETNPNEGEENGKSFLKWLHETHHDTEAIMLTAYGSDQFARDVAEFGAYSYADKADVLGDANEAQDDRTIGGVHSRTFLFHIRNCIQRLQMRRRKDRVIKLIASLQQRAPTQDFDSRLQAIVQIPSELNSSIGFVSIRMPIMEGGHQRLRFWGPEASELTVGDLLDRNQGITGEVLKTGKPHSVPSNLDEDPKFIRTWNKSKAALCVPIRGRGGKVIAVLNVESVQEGSLSEDDLRDIEMLAATAAPSIQDAVLFREIMSLAADLNRTTYREQTDETAHDVLDSLATSNPDGVKHLFELVLKGAFTLTSAKLGVAFLADHKRKKLRQVCHVGMGKKESVETREVDFDGKAVVAEALRTGKPQRTTGMRERDDALWEQYMPFKQRRGKGPKSFLCVPMVFSKRVVGVIDLESTDPFVFSLVDEKVIEAFSNMAATALFNLALIESIKEHELLKIQEAIHRHRADLVALAAHDARSPLNQIGLALSRAKLQLEEGKGDYDNIKALLAEAIERVDVADQSVSNSLKLADLEADKEAEYERVDLVALLDSEARQLTAKVLTGYAVAIEPELANADIDVYANPESLMLVVRELINNAAAAAEEGKLTIKSSGNNRSGVVSIDFSDNGPGVPKKMEAKVFDPRTSSKENGGYGLHKCRVLMRLQGGGLELFENSPNGATFRLWLTTVAARG